MKEKIRIKMEGEIKVLVRVFLDYFYLVLLVKRKVRKILKQRIRKLNF